MKCPKCKKETDTIMEHRIGNDWICKKKDMNEVLNVKAQV